MNTPPGKTVDRHGDEPPFWRPPGRQAGGDQRSTADISASRSQTRPKRNRFAIAALVFGIVFLYGLGSILAVTFGYIALRQIRHSQGSQTGRGMAIAGMVLGSLELLLLVLIVIVAALGSHSGGVVF